MVQMLKKQYELLSFNGPPKIIKFQISSTKLGFICDLFFGAWNFT
jgi:hypothetical protein